MKTAYVIGMCGVMSYWGGAHAAISGFVDNAACDAIIAFTACVTREIQKGVVFDGDCSGSYKVTLPDSAKAAADCAALYPSVSYENRDLAVKYAEAICFDYAILSRCDSQNLSVSARDHIGSLFKELLARGYCACPTGDYIQPRGLDIGYYGLNSTCMHCPDGGTSDGGIGLNTCRIPAGGTFSDDTGSGVVEGDCYAGYDSEEEELAAWQ